jgi:hypothetical protein
MKMKKIFALIIIAGFFASCTDLDLEEQKITTIALDGYVSFANAGGTVTPIALNITETTAATQNLRIECPTGSLSEITVTYTFSGSAVFNTDFTVVSPAGGTSTAAGGTIIIKRNTTTGGVNDFDFANLGIKAAADGVADGAKQLVVTLTGATDASGKTYTIGRGTYMKSATVNFSDVN